jgi:hypothetical protein
MLTIMSRSAQVLFSVATLTLGCSEMPDGTCEVRLELTPTAVSANGTPSRVRVRATSASGTIGRGTVRLSAPVGEFENSTLTLDAFGTAETTYRCVGSATTECTGTVTLTAAWDDSGAFCRGNTVSTFSTAPSQTSSCKFGTAKSLATSSTLDLFGAVIYFNGGQPLPAGSYRVRYIDGCFRYGANQGWTVHGYADGRSTWFVVAEARTNKLVVPPGNVGFILGSGGFANFEDCVNASRAMSPRDFQHPGGRIGIWLEDEIYSDNSPGENGRNPSWELSTVDCQP